MNRGRGRPKQEEPNQQLAWNGQENVVGGEIDKLQLYYYFTVGRRFIDFHDLPQVSKLEILAKLDVLDRIDVDRLIGKDKILTADNLDDWFSVLRQHRLQMKVLDISIKENTRVISAAQNVVRLFGFDIVRFGRMRENGGRSYLYKGADPDANGCDKIIADWLQRDLSIAK